MNATSDAVAAKPGPPKKGRYFFVALAVLFFIITALGFGSDYMVISSGTATVHWFALLHGVIMTAWLLVFFLQSLLAAKGHLGYHKRLGLFSAGLGAVVWLSMIIATIRPLIAYPPPPDDNRWDGLLIQLYGITLFGVFFTWSMVGRKKAAAHKRLIFFATLVLMQAGIDRIPFLPGLPYAVYVRFIYLDTLVVPLLIYDLVRLGKIYKMTIIGGMIILLIQFTVSVIWESPVWRRLCYHGFAPFTEKIVEVKLSDAQIQPRLGNYGDKKWHVSIYRDSSKLYLKLPDQPKFEISTTSENEWFLKHTYWKVIFVKGANDSITKIINKQPSNNWEVQRMK